MVNILLSRCNTSWCADELKPYLNSDARVAVIAFSFRECEITNVHEWEKYYGENGYMSSAIETSLLLCGIKRENIVYIDYFRDTPETAMQKFDGCEVVYFPGGLQFRRGEPDKIMTRAIEFKLFNAIEQHRGVTMGFGAGAQVQLANYHISKKGQRMSYSLGFRYVDGFDIEPNYRATESQNFFIRRVVTETGIPVYAVGEEGAIIVDNGDFRAIGAVHCFRKKV
jgi:hypothetical protein